jgi:tetratricopeptide (TPR) repeat protein
VPSVIHDQALASNEAEATPGLAPALVVGAILLVAPWTAGAVSPLATGAFALLGAGLLATLAAEPACLGRGRVKGLRWLGVAVAGLLALGALQLVPLGPLLGLLSPASAELRAANAPGGVDPLGCVALYPEHARVALLGLAVAAAVFLTCARALPREGPRWFARLFVIAAALHVVLAFGLLVQSGKWSWLRAGGAYPSPNHFGLLLALCLPLSLHLSGLYSERPDPRRRLRWGLLAGVLALGIVLSRSRSAVVASAVALLAQAWLCRNPRTKGRSVVVTLGAVGLGVATAGWHALGSRFGKAIEGHEAERVAFWLGGLEVWTRFPLLGAGLRSHDEITPSLLDHPRLVNATHNDYINLLADLGLVGVALVALGVVAFVKLARAGLSRARGEERRLGGSLLASLLAVAAVSAFEFNLQIRANLWLIAGLAGMALAVLPTTPSRPVSEAGRSWAQRLGWALLAGALVLGAGGAGLIAADYSLRQGLDKSLPEGTRTEWLERARRMSRTDARPEAELGRLHLQAGRYAEAEAGLRRATLRRPRWADYQVDLARAAYGADHLALGDEALERAGRLAPNFPIPRFEAARLWRWRSLGKKASPRAREACVEALRDTLRHYPEGYVPALEELVGLPNPTPAEAARALEPLKPALRIRAAHWLGYVGRERIHRHLAAELGRAVLAPLVGPESGDDVLILEGSLHVLRGKPTPAIEVWLEAYAKAQNPSKVLAQACHLLETKGLEPLALILCERAAERRPEVAAAWLQVGLRQRRRGSVIQATRALERAATIDPLAGGQALGDAYAAQGLEQSAQTAYRRALEKAIRPPVRIALRVRLGRSYLRQGDRAAAVAEAEAALRLDGEHVGAGKLLADARRAPK